MWPPASRVAISDADEGGVVLVSPLHPPPGEYVHLPPMLNAQGCGSRGAAAGTVEGGTDAWSAALRHVQFGKLGALVHFTGPNKPWAQLRTAQQRAWRGMQIVLPVNSSTNGTSGTGTKPLLRPAIDGVSLALEDMMHELEGGKSQEARARHTHFQPPSTAHSSPALLLRTTLSWTIAPVFTPVFTPVWQTARLRRPASLLGSCTQYTGLSRWGYSTEAQTNCSLG